MLLALFVTGVAGSEPALADGYNLYVKVSGAGQITGTHIHCWNGGGDCERLGMVSGQGVDLNAEPDAARGWRFSHWTREWDENDHGCGGAARCEFALQLTCFCHRAIVLRANFVTSVGISGAPTHTVAPGHRTFGLHAHVVGGTRLQCRAWHTSGSAPNWQDCGGSVGYDAVQDGGHRLEARVVDDHGLSGGVASVDWQVDAVPPVATIESAPPVVKRDRTADARFDFRSEVGARFECQLDGAGWAPCSPPVRFERLSEGSHRFRVRAIDAFGNVGIADEWNWTQEIPPETTLDGGPAEGSTIGSNSAVFRLASDDPLARFDCRLDDGDWRPCTSPRTISALPDGKRRLYVRAADPRGNIDDSPAIRRWTVDTTPPDTVIVEGPTDGAKTSETSARFEFRSEAGARFECNLDGGGFLPCPGNVPGNAPLARLTYETHTFEVRAIDGVGNKDASPARRRWTVIADGDGDGYAGIRDCDDTSRTIHPGANDVPRNGIDEDCRDGDNRDGDGDGYSDPPDPGEHRDCDDARPAVNPGAFDRPRSGLDEDCANGDADFPRIQSDIHHAEKGVGRFTRIRRLRVSSLPADATVTVRCKGKRKGCKFRVRSVRAVPGRQSLRLARHFRGVKLAPGARVTVTVRAPNVYGKALRLKARKRAEPKTTWLKVDPVSGEVSPW